MLDRIRDLRIAVRSLARRPGFAIVAVATLALGIGATTAVYTVVDAVLLGPLPYPDSDRLVRVFETFPEQGVDRNPVTPGNYGDWREEDRIFEALAAWTYGAADFTGAENGTPERVPYANVAASFFRVLDVPPRIGRTWSAEEADSGCFLVLSEDFWRERLGGREDAVGEDLVLPGEACRVLGVLPASVRLPEDVELWSNLVLDAEDFANRKSHYLRVIGRLKPDLSVAQAQEAMDTVVARIAREHPQWMTGWGAAVVPLQRSMVSEVRTALLVLLGAVGLVLAIACANVANLLLAQAAGRDREMATRAALGASRGQLLRQLLSESLVLALVGSAAGVLLAAWGVELLLALYPGSLPRSGEVAVDGRILLFALAVSLLASLAFGLVPAIRLRERRLRRGLASGHFGTDQGRQRLRGGLVVAELALAVTLAVGAGLLVGSLWKLSQVDTGFEPEGLVESWVLLPSARYPEIEDHTRFVERAVGRVESLPGVASAAASTRIPLAGSAPTFSFAIEGRPEPAPGEWIDLPYHAVTPGYFETLGIPRVAGRLFDRRDSAEAPAVLVISEAMARRFWGDESPLGARLRFRTAEFWYTVVGVVGNVHEEGLDVGPGEVMYAPMAQRKWGWMSSIHLVARAQGDPRPLLPSLREAIWSLDPELPATPRTFDELMARSTAERRFQMVLLGLFAALALVLSSCGVFGVMAALVAARRREIGVRMALGARRTQVLAWILRHGVALTALGLGLGVLGAIACSRWLESLLFGVSPTEPAVFAGVAALLALVALSAAYLPARRAARIDPAAILRSE